MLKTLSSTALSYREVLLNLPPSIRYFVLSAISLIVLSIFFMVVLYLRRWWMLKRIKNQKEYRFRFQYFIYDALVESSQKGELSTSDLILKKFQQNELDTPMKRQLMTDLIMELKRSFNGNSARQFESLYIRLELHQDSIAKLSSRNYVRRLRGIRELSDLYPECPQLERLLENCPKNLSPLMADEISIAALRSASPKALISLLQQQGPMSEWLQIQLHHQLTLMPTDQRPDLAEWLQVEEPAALRFAIRMIAEFRQENAREKLIQLLHHTDHEVKKETLLALETLDAREACSTLFHLLDTEDEQLKVATIRAIGKLGSVFHANLLKPLQLQSSPKVAEAARQAVEMIQSMHSLTLSITDIHSTDNIKP